MSHKKTYIKLNSPTENMEHSDLGFTSYENHE